MPILREKQTWRRERVPRHADLVNRLTPEQAANVRAAMRVLHIRLGTWSAVATALGMKPNTLEHMIYGRRHPQAGHALRVATLAGVPAEDVLSGAFPRPGSCPMCGRS